MIKLKHTLFIGLLIISYWVKGQDTNEYHEKYRPQIHFSPLKHWMNDPNGMVYFKGTYHLFFQYYPGGMTWGPMHWGHATSTDLFNWQEKPIALYPDSIGYIFSGSVVVDENNTSGFGGNGKIPMVAIFTSHNPARERQKRLDYQNQSIAYSLDNGDTWVKYKANPVLKNPGISDFRDPKVSWNNSTKRWIMTLATKDRVTFFSSSNLKNWAKESEFGQTIGAHTGVWECPDLFSLKCEGKTLWVLTVSINPGGPNGGSATQYFIGDFDGKKFIPFSTQTKWVDYGTDDYAGVTWSNTGNRKVFLGWMSNWEYANRVPTFPWRSAMTIPRDLAIKRVNGEYFLTSNPSKEIEGRSVLSASLKNLVINKEFELTKNAVKSDSLFQLKFSSTQLKDFDIILSNQLGEKVIIGYDVKSNQYYIDREKSGKVDFAKGFAKRQTAPRLTNAKSFDFKIVVDVASAEIFADGGLTVMTGIFFPTKPFTHISINSSENFSINKLNYFTISSGWSK
jgi:fructan beta-fructosidase